MKFGKLVRSAVLAATCSAGAAFASPFYFFGNDPGANGNVIAGVNSRVAEGLFTTQVLVGQTETFGPALSSPSSVFLSSTNNSSPIFNGSLVQAPSPPSGDWGDSYVGAGIISGPPGSGRFNTTGNLSNGRWLESELSFSISIGERVQAFAFFGTDFADFRGSLSIELFDGMSTSPLLFDDGNGGTRTNVFIDPATGLPAQPRGMTPQDAGMLFFGFASPTQFDRIQFTIAQGSTTPFGDWDYLGFDDIRVGNLRTPSGNVPEPGSLALVGLALFAAGWARKTQRRT